VTYPLPPATHADWCQNRELQIMRIVRHPNIVELKAFFYNNGDRVRAARPAALVSLLC
jgi:hypothetical protein